MRHWYHLEIENVYEGETIRTTATVHAPAMPSDSDALHEWEQEHLNPATGTGRTTGKSGYVVHITDSSDLRAVGHVYEWF